MRKGGNTKKKKSLYTLFRSATSKRIGKKKCTELYVHHSHNKDNKDEMSCWTDVKVFLICSFHWLLKIQHITFWREHTATSYAAITYDGNHDIYTAGWLFTIIFAVTNFIKKQNVIENKMGDNINIIFKYDVTLRLFQLSLKLAKAFIKLRQCTLQCSIE